MLEIFSTLLVLYILLFIASIYLKDNSLVDIFWGIGFVIIAFMSFLNSEQGISQYLVTGLVILWGVRIALHIGMRKLKHSGEDPRYAEWRKEWGNGIYFYVRSFFQVYVLQLVLMMVVSSAIIITNSFYGDIGKQDQYILPNFQVLNDAIVNCGDDTNCIDAASISFLDSGTSRGSTLTLISLIGGIIALFGLIFEAIADRQLTKFMKIKKPGQIFTKGLYQYSRHPNYFGESMFWLGISIISMQISYYGIISFIVITLLLLFVSGIPPQEKRYEGRTEWEKYKEKTSIFIPWFPTKIRTGVKI